MPSLQDANAFRLGPVLGEIGSLCSALSAESFEPERASQALEALRSKWRGRFQSENGMLSVEWPRQSDCGQCLNAYATRKLTPPMVAACRWGSAASIEWLCQQPGVEPVVRFTEAAEFWSFSMASSNGISGALGPLWDMAKRLGWEKEELAKAMSSWLSGAQAGPRSSFQASIERARALMPELLLAIPDLVLPLTPSGVFGSAMSAAICSDRDGDSVPSSMAVEGLLSVGPASLWRHESLDPESEIWDLAQESASCASSFAEDALSMGNSEALACLWRAGFECPSRERVDAMLGGRLSGWDSEVEAALDLVLERWARAEAKELEEHTRGLARKREERDRSKTL